MRALQPLGVQPRWLPHLLAYGEPDTTWATPGLILLDACDLDAQQGDPTCSRLAALDIIDLLSAVPPAQRPRVVCYSAGMEAPELNIPLRQNEIAEAFYEADRIIPNLGSIIHRTYDGQVRAPEATDFALLDPNLPAHADLAAAHQKIRQHERAWRVIWDDDMPFDKAAQVWITRNILPLLGLSSSDGYAVAKKVIRQMAGLPVRFFPG